MNALAHELVAAAAHLAGLGLSPGSSGNVSVRDGDRVLTTPQRPPRSRRRARRRGAPRRPGR
ncbi:class II aldolase/adducin family protein, partial [Streptomyces sp. NPDC005047]